MRKIILYSASSLDGYIARSDGSIDWLHDPALEIEGEDFGFAGFIERVDTALIGNNTYRQMLGFEGPDPTAHLQYCVFSRTPGRQPSGNARFISDDIPGFVRRMKAQAGKDIWLVGGGQINAVLLRAGLIDEFIITFIPVFLGDGIPLFAGKTREKKVKLLESRAFPNGMVQVKTQVSG